jgi:hypothetical protein
MLFLLDGFWRTMSDVFAFPSIRHFLNIIFGEQIPQLISSIDKTIAFRSVDT